jgi:hypothetical protein
MPDDPIDILALIETDARVFLRNSERYRFTDGVVGDNGPHVFGVDYKLGDIIGVYDAVLQVVNPVRVDEIVMTFEPGSTKFIPTLTAYSERDPEEQ